jgi:chromosome condensin MukBEF ATPase and DNA-binding subunit MukB
MEAGRHELLEQKSDLEESLEETYRDLETANERLHELEETLEETQIERDSLLATRDTYQHAADREAALQMQIREQQLAFEERLNEIRGILGLKFTAAITTEVHEKFRNVEMPIAFRVPLLATKIV